MGIKEKIENFSVFGHKNAKEETKKNAPENSDKNNDENAFKKKLEDANNGESSTDDDQNFIKKDDKESGHKIAHHIMDELKSVIGTVMKSLEGVRPQGYHARNLDHETGGVEKEQDKEVSGVDAWDNRHKEVQAMIEDAQDLNNDSKSTRGQSFLHRKKQEEKKEKKRRREEGVEGAAEMTLAQRIKMMRGDKDSSLGQGVGGAGQGIDGFGGQNGGGGRSR